MGIVEKAGMVIYPVEDLEATARFYTDALGLEERFRDGDRFCAFDAGGVTIALAAADERLSDSPVLSLKVGDLSGAIRTLVAAGASLVRPEEDGPHERRAVLADPSGNALVLYAEKSRTA